METTAPDPAPNSPDYRRAVPRRRVLKSAKLVVNGGVFDCAVLNISARGARVALPGPTPMPERVALHLSGGTIYQARRCWARGQDIGVEFEDAPTLGTIAADRAWPLYEALRDLAPDAVLVKLQAERWFDDPELAQLAQRFSEAYAALAAALCQRAARGQPPAGTNGA